MEFTKYPHDHDVDWSNGFPKLGPPINYSNGAPDFKNYDEMRTMANNIPCNSLEENRFKTISDFKWCVNNGGEIEFVDNEKIFGIFPKLKKTEDSEQQMLISQTYIDHPEEHEKWCNTADEVLEYTIDGICLRDIITQVAVVDRTV